MKRNDTHGFTRFDLLAICAGLFLCVIIVLPALGRTRNNSSLIQSMNNLRQLTSAWSMYSSQNSDRLVYSDPDIPSPLNTNTWCRGNGSDGGGSIYTTGPADPLGIERGDLWPYVKTLKAYKCPADKRLATQSIGAFKNQPILRTYAMNCYLAGSTFGTAHDVFITSPQTVDQSDYKLFTRESQIPKPAQLFVFIEEDGGTIDDGMFLVDMGEGSTQRTLNSELPTRHHSNCYPISFADGRVESSRLVDRDSIVTGTNGTFNGGIHDWATLTNVATVPR